jgi:hypothetical protein
MSRSAPAAITGKFQVLNAHNYVFYFESGIAKVFPFRPTCSSYDFDIEKKAKKAKRDQQKK